MTNQVNTITLEAQAKLPTQFGDFNVAVFLSHPDNLEHTVVYMGELKNQKDVLVRAHSQCLTGDTLHSLRCDCQQQLKLALQKISEEKRGMVIYLNQEGRGIGLTNKIRAYELQDKGMDTADSNKALGFNIDERDMWVAADIIKHYKIQSIRLLTNNPEKISALKQHGIHNIQRRAIQAKITEKNKKYLGTKKEKMGHLIDGV